MFKYLFPYRYYVRKIVNKVIADLKSGNYQDHFGFIEPNSDLRLGLSVVPRVILPGYKVILSVNDLEVWLPLLVRWKLCRAVFKVMTTEITHVATVPVVTDPPKVVAKKKGRPKVK